MTKLLVSVRDATEGKIALEAGVDLIDIKEPNRGSLGKADDRVIDEIKRVVGQRRPLSAALGELAYYTDDDLARLTLPTTLNFVKIGLAHCGENPSWPRRLSMLWESMPTSIGRIAVIYADWQAAGAPSPEEVLHHAVNLKCSGVLVDTFDKSRSGLTAIWTPTQLREISRVAQRLNLVLVFAGRVSLDDVAHLLLYRPDYLAVRGAVCHPDRNGTVETERICLLRKLIAANSKFA